jgi:thioredoxin-like negative regulator of GroEL
VRRVQDELARAFSSAFHAALAADPTRAAAAFRAAVVSVARQSPTADWSAFRLFVP